MKNTIRKTFAVIMAATMITGIAPANSICQLDFGITASAELIVTDNMCGENAVWSLNEGVLTISGTGATYNYSDTVTPWADVSNTITSVVVSDGITSIGSNAFKEIHTITSVSLPDSLTSIGDSAFSGCNFTQIDLPPSLTSIGNSAFEGCSSLITFFNFSDTVTFGERVFKDCGSLSFVFMPYNVTSLGKQMFSGCSALTEIEGIDRITSIGEGAFESCLSLTEIVLPSSLTSIGLGAFENCPSLERIFFKGSKVEWQKCDFEIPENITVIYSHDGSRLIQGKCGDNSNYKFDARTGVLTYSGKGAIKHSSALDEYSHLFTKIIIEDGIEEITSGTFRAFSSIYEIIIPASVKKIGNDALSCQIDTIYFCGTKTEWQAMRNAAGCNDNFGNRFAKLVFHVHDWIKISDNGNKASYVCECGSETTNPFTLIPLPVPNPNPNPYPYGRFPDVLPFANNNKLTVKNKINVSIRGDSATLSWDKVRNADGYRIYDASGELKVLLGETDDTEYVIDNLKNDKEYEVVVSPFRNGKDMSDKYVMNIFLSSIYKPRATIESGYNYIRLEWNKVHFAQKYAVYKVVDGKAVQLWTGRSRALKIKGLESGTEYQYIIRAYIDGEWTTMTTNDIITASTI